MSGIVLAWLAGESLIIWRSVVKNHHMPVPGTLLGSAGFFALLAILGQYEPARMAATATAWGFNLAAVLNLLPEQIAPSSSKAAAAKAASSGAASGKTTGAQPA